jgi:hypothetical protein
MWSQYHTDTFMKIGKVRRQRYAVINCLELRKKKRESGNFPRRAAGIPSSLANYLCQHARPPGDRWSIRQADGKPLS